MTRLVLLLKAATPPGARWVTVHPHGPGEKGTPILIEPQADGSAKVIGGAGGALNHLRIRAVRSEAEYQQEAEKKRAAKREEAKAQRAKDKEAGLLESKKKAREQVRQQQVQAEQKFVQAVAGAMGWKPEELEFKPPEGVSDAAAKQAAAWHHAAVLKRANEAVEQQRQRLVADADLRAQAGLGEVPLTTSDPRSLTVDDIATIPPSNGGLTVSHDYAKRAEAAGLTAEERRAEAAAAKPMSDEDRAKAVKRGDTAKMVKQEIAKIREPELPTAKADLVDAKKAVEMLRARKELLAMQRQASKARGEIDKSAVEPKAYVLEYTASPDEDAKLAEDVANDLRTARTAAFLSEFREMAGGKPEETLGKHMLNGAFNSANSLALAVSGQAMIDRSVVDVLGIAGAAQVLARRIAADMPEQADRVADGMQEFHLHHYMDTSEQAMAEARDLMAAAKEIEVGEANSGHDLAAAQELNAKRRRAVNDAQRILGRAAGEMEMNAALVLALKQRGSDKPLQVSLGKLSADDAVTRARAIGLQRGDYSISQSGGNTFLTVSPAGMDRLAKPIDRAEVEALNRNLGIMAGREDEDGWLPDGVARRPDLALPPAPPGVAPRLARPFEPGGDLHQSLKDYIGGRAADGDTPADIVADIQSADFFQKAGPGYLEALQAVAPLKDDKGRQRRVEDLGDTFDTYADEFVNREYGGARSPLNRQALQLDDTTTEALHRALSEHPDGVAAYKAIGDLTPQDQRTLRETFYRDIAHESPEAAQLRHDLEEHEGQEPERETTDMFGETMENPEWTGWKVRRDELAEKAGAAKLDWAKYAEAMRGHEKAYEAVQDLIRGRVGKAFADTHNRLRPGAPVKLGRAVIRQNLNHLDATDPAARDERQARERELIDSLRERVGGRYAAGAVSDKLDAARDEREAFEQAQMGFFSTEDAPVAQGDRPLAGDERHTLGHVAERQIAAIMGQVGQNFRPGEGGFRLGEPSMSGGDNFARQRTIKLFEANKRLGAHLGAGSGKTLVSMAAFTHLHARGKVKRGLYVVPSVVQGQFGGEALKYLEPGKFKWHCEPGASREERIKAYKDGSNHFCVVTHQALRDDLIHMAAAHDGISEKQVREKLGAMTREERKAWGQQVMQREGINFDLSAVDEGHNLLDRAGKEDSGLSLAIGAVTDNTPYHMNMTADPVRNDDPSEVFSALQKIAPDRYTDRAAFMRRYGADTLAAKDGLRREMARHFYAHSIAPPVRADRQTVDVKLSRGQQEALGALDKDLAAMRLARISGRADVEAAKRVNPGAFEGRPASEHEAVAKNLQGAMGILRESATQRIINAHPDNAKTEELVKQIKARQGKPGMVFAHSVDAVKAIEQRLTKEGLRVVTITGADLTAEKDRKRRMFHPDSGEPQADILVASDAASTGLNAQRGQWLVQYDTPMTAMTHAQRNARIHRIGQKNDVELIDLVADHPSERRARDRLAKKYAMRELMTSNSERLDDTGVAHYLRQRDVAALDAGQQGLL